MRIFPSSLRRARTPLSMAAIATALVILAPSSAQASAVIPGAEWEREARVIEAVPTADGFSFRSVRDSDEAYDEVIGNYEGALDRFQVGLASHRPEGRLLVNLSFVAIYEFRDVDESGGYSLGDDVVGRTRLRDVPRSAVLTDLRPDLEGGYVAVITYPITAPPTSPAAPGTFTLRFYLVREPRLIDELEAVPTAVRMEFLIEGYPYTANDTLLALETRADGSPRLDSRSGSLRGRAEPFEAVFGWESVARQGPDRGDVQAAVVQAPPIGTSAGVRDQSSVLFSYPRSDDETLHATAVGFRRQADAGLPEIIEQLSGGDWRLYVAALAATVGVLSVTVWRRVRA